MIETLRVRTGWQLGGVLLAADRALAVVWLSILVLRGLLPALFAIAMGALVGAVQRGDSGGRLLAPLSVVGIVFVLLQVLAPVHQAASANLGSRTAAWRRRTAWRGTSSTPPPRRRPARRCG